MPISISFASSPLVGPIGHSSSQRQRSWRCSCSRNICREEPVFAGKVTCGVRNETSGQSWPSNTVATDLYTGQNRNSNVAAVSSTNVWAVGGQRLVLLVSNASLHWVAVRGVLSSLSFSPITGRQRPFYRLRWTWSCRVCQQLPDCRLANWTVRRRNCFAERTCRSRRTCPQ